MGYNALDELAFLYKSYDQGLEVTSGEDKNLKVLVRKTSVSQFHYNALEELAQLYSIPYTAIRKESDPTSGLRKRPLSIIPEKVLDTLSEPTSDGELPATDWNAYYDQYDTEGHEDSALVRRCYFRCTASTSTASGKWYSRYT